MSALFWVFSAWGQPTDSPFAKLATRLLAEPSEQTRQELLSYSHELATSDLIKAMNELAGQVYDRRNYAAALPMYRTTCEVATRIGDQSGVARCSLNAGLCESRLSHFDESRAYLDRAFSIYQAEGDHVNSARVLNAF